ncbi:Peroxidase 6, partial [Linum grandiflorum]
SDEAIAPIPHPLFCLLLSSSNNRLSLDYYKTTCPQFNEIVADVVTTKQISNPTTAAASLRIFFHDCMVDGCDASVLVAPNTFKKVERDNELDSDLPGDGFDVVTRAKTALELACPKTVSCADILAEAARDLVVMVGGPNYPVLLGRKDSLVSMSTSVVPNLPLPNMTMDRVVSLFESKGFTIQDMVALMGAHTIGFSHCKQFAKRIYNFSKGVETDPEMNPTYAAGLKKFCANYTKDPTMSAFNDLYTPGKFDNMYYQNLLKGMGLLATDQMMMDDPRTKKFVTLYAANQTAFFDDFSKAMEKLSVLDVKIGNEGDVRNRCDEFNTVKA